VLRKRTILVPAGFGIGVDSGRPAPFGIEVEDDDLDVVVLNYLDLILSKKHCPSKI
jgi:hypothetical protein